MPPRREPQEPLRRASNLGFALLLVGGLGVMLLFDDYTLYRLTLAGVLALAVLGLSLLTGLSGQFSIGHSAFFAAGAYTTAVGMNEFGLSAYLTIPMAAVVAFVIGAAFGWPASRFGSVHLALVTWGMAVSMPRLLKSPALEGWTGGVQGIYLLRPPPPSFLPLSEDQWWHVVVLAILLCGLWLGRNLGRGRPARALRAIKDQQIAAASMGIPVAGYKTTIFGISAAYAGVAGSLMGLLTDFVAPDSYGVFFSIMLLVGAVAGGLGSIWGALFGGLLIQYLPDLAANASAALSFPAYGLILLALVYLFPAGMAGGVARWFERLQGRRRESN
jgi:branched-chain amino acid transport system permease protein